MDSQAKKKVLVVATTPLRIDGLTEMLITLAKMVGEACTVDFSLGVGAEEGILLRLNQIGRVFTQPDRNTRTARYVLSMRRLIRREGYDIVHIHGNSATMAIDLLASLDAPVRITHCHNWARQPRIKTLFLGTLMNRLVTAPVACARDAGEALYTRPFVIIHNGVDTERFQFSQEVRDRVRKRLGLAEDALVVGHIGRFTPQKNHERLLCIFEQVLRSDPRAVLVLCGTGELESKIQERIRESRLEPRKVRMMGVISDPQEYLMAFDVLVMPSIFEGLPLVGVEAQATGLPCVFSETITREAAICPEVSFVPLEASDATWAEVIRETVVHASGKSRAEAAGRVKAEGYDLSTVREQVRNLYGLG